jgi:hypothetical protein
VLVLTLSMALQVFTGPEYVIGIAEPARHEVSEVIRSIFKRWVDAVAVTVPLYPGCGDSG